MKNSAETPWTAAVRYADHDGMRPEEENIWHTFIEWYDDLERFVVASGQEQAGFAAISLATRAYLWRTGANLIRSEVPEVIGDRLSSMPKFPEVWPISYSSEPIVQRLNEFSSYESIPAGSDEENHAIANDLREHAIKILQISQVFNTL